MFINVVKTLTSHWFLIVLAQVDQIPQSWVELFHHTLGGWRQKERQLVIISFKVLMVMWIRWGRVKYSHVRPWWLFINRSYELWPLGTCMPCRQSYVLRGDWQRLQNDRQYSKKKTNKRTTMRGNNVRPLFLIFLDQSHKVEPSSITMS